MVVALSKKDALLNQGHQVVDHEILARGVVHQTADALHTSASGQATDRRLGDSLDVVLQHLLMTLWLSHESLAKPLTMKSLASFASSRHFGWMSFFFEGGVFDEKMDLKKIQS